MDERSSKRARQQRGVGSVGGGLPQTEGDDGFSGGGGGGGFSRTSSLAGCHLRVEAAQTHLFLGMPIELKVSLLNDEDVVQRMTQDINVSITGEDGKAVPNMFDLTPQRPALLDGTSTFQLLLWTRCVRAGNRVKVHVEAPPSGRGGEQVKANSVPIMVCRSGLNVVKQPPDNWYKDEGGKNNCIAIDVMVREKSSGKSGQVQPGVPLTLALVYENGTEVHSQEILQVQSDTQLVTSEQGRATLRFRITEVSQRHQSQRFCVKISPDTKLSPECSDVAPVVTVPIMVLSKRKNRRIKAEREKQAQLEASAYGRGGSMVGAQQSAGLNSLLWATAGANQLPQSAMNSPASSVQQHWGAPGASMLAAASAGRGGGGHLVSPPHHHHPQQHMPPAAAAAAAAAAAHTVEAAAAAVSALRPAGAVAANVPVSAPVEDIPLRVPPGSTGALQRVFKWTDAVLQLLQMELQWEHIGYEHEPDGTIAYGRPLFRCPVCRVCKSAAQPHQKHAPDCKLRGLLGEFAGRTVNDFTTVVREQQQQQQQQQHGGVSGAAGGVASPAMGVAGRGAVGRGSGGGGGGPKEGFRGFGGEEGGAPRMEASGLSRGPASAILGLKSGSDGPPREHGNVASSSAVGGGVQAGGHFLSAMQSHELLPGGASAGMPRGLSIGFSAMFDNSMVPAGSAGEAAGGSRGGDDNSSLARTGSVAPFVPQRNNLTPAEERAHYIMLPFTTSSSSATAAGEGVAGEGGGSSGGRQLTVFSGEGALLGFYEEKYDVGQQTHLPFQGFEGHFSPGAKRDVEAKLQAALDEDCSGTATGSGDSSNRKGPLDSAGAENGDGDGPADASSTLSKKRSGPGRPTRSPSATPSPGVKREVGKKEVGRYPKVYKLDNFQGYQEMKEQVFYDWSLGQTMDMNVFDPVKTDGKTQQSKTSTR